MSFGLKNSLSSFQRLMDIVLNEVRYKFAMTYMDAVIFSRNLEEHFEHLAIILQKMQRVGLTVNPKKAQLACLKVDLLGFIVDDGQLRPNDAKPRAIAEYPLSRDVNEFAAFSWSDCILSCFHTMLRRTQSITAKRRKAELG